MIKKYNYLEREIKQNSEKNSSQRNYGISRIELDMAIGRHCLERISQSSEQDLLHNNLQKSQKN